MIHGEIRAILGLKIKKNLMMHGEAIQHLVLQAVIRTSKEILMAVEDPVGEEEAGVNTGEEEAEIQMVEVNGPRDEMDAEEAKTKMKVGAKMEIHGEVEIEVVRAEDLVADMEIEVVGAEGLGVEMETEEAILVARVVKMVENLVGAILVGIGDLEVGEEAVDEVEAVVVVASSLLIGITSVKNLWMVVSPIKILVEATIKKETGTPMKEARLGAHQNHLMAISPLVGTKKPPLKIKGMKVLTELLLRSSWGGANPNSMGNWNVMKNNGGDKPAIWNKNSAAGEAGKGGAGGGDWAASRTYSGGNQSSGNGNAGNSWASPKPGNDDTGNSWASPKPWNSGKNDDQQGGWQGNTNNRGRGRDRNSPGGRWDGGAGSDRDVSGNGEQGRGGGRGRWNGEDASGGGRGRWNGEDGSGNGEQGRGGGGGRGRWNGESRGAVMEVEEGVEATGMVDLVHQMSLPPLMVGAMVGRRLGRWKSGG